MELEFLPLQLSHHDFPICYTEMKTKTTMVDHLCYRHWLLSTNTHSRAM